MSIHSSFRSGGDKLAGFRNVIKRHERLQLLISQGRWADEQSVFGLPKFKPEKRKAKKAAPKEAAAETAEATPAASDAGASK